MPEKGLEIMSDKLGDFIIVNGEKRYWRGIIDDVPELNVQKELGLVIIKPDGVKEGLTDQIMNDILLLPLTPLLQQKIVLNEERVLRLYAYFHTESFLKELIHYMTSSSSLFILVSGKNVSDLLFNYKKELRKKLCRENPLKNIIHCSDCSKNALREALIVFSLEEISNTLS